MVEAMGLQTKSSNTGCTKSPNCRLWLINVLYSISFRTLQLSDARLRTRQVIIIIGLDLKHTLIPAEFD